MNYMFLVQIEFPSFQLCKIWMWRIYFFNIAFFKFPSRLDQRDCRQNEIKMKLKMPFVFRSMNSIKLLEVYFCILDF